MRHQHLSPSQEELEIESLAEAETRLGLSPSDDPSFFKDGGELNFMERQGLSQAKIFQEFLSWYQQQHKSSLADAFAQLRQICVEEDYIFDLPSRLE